MLTHILLDPTLHTRHSWSLLMMHLRWRKSVVVLVLPLPLLVVLCWWRLMVIALLDIEDLLLSALEDV